MVQVKPVTTFSGDGKKKPSVAILESLNYLFYVSKVVGIVPYSLADYVTKRQLKLSLFGCFWCLITWIQITIQYYILTSQIMESRDSHAIGMLTRVIGVIIVYMEPAMMLIDVLAALFNQKAFIEVFDRLRDLDEKLKREDVSINYNVMKKYSIIFIVIAAVFEFTLSLLNLIVFGIGLNFSVLFIMWNFVTNLPLFCNSIARTWFIILILLVQQRLRAINSYLEETRRIFYEMKTKRFKNPNFVDLKKDNIFIENAGFLEKEIFTTKNLTFKKNLLGSGNEPRWVEQSSRSKFGDIFAREVINVTANDANKGN